MKKGLIYYVSENSFWMIGRCKEDGKGKSENDGCWRCLATYITSCSLKTNQTWSYQNDHGRTYRLATPEEIKWLNTCISKHMYVDKFVIDKIEVPVVNNSYIIL